MFLYLSKKRTYVIGLQFYIYKLLKWLELAKNWKGLIPLKIYSFNPENYKNSAIFKIKPFYDGRWSQLFLDLHFTQRS